MDNEGSREPESERLPIFYPRGSMVCTKSMYFYLSDFEEIIDLFFMTVRLEATADDYAERGAILSVTIDKALMAASAIEKVATEELEARRDATLEKIKTDGASKKLEKYSMMNARYLVTSLTDSFLTYVSHLIQSTLKKNRNTLKSGETVRIDDLLDFKKNSDLVNFLIDRKINELSYGGLRKIEEYARDRLGIDMLKDNKARDLLVIFLELRNIYVHNRGYVNDVFLNRVRDQCGFAFHKNKRYQVDFSELCTLANNCADVAMRLDEVVSTKFHLERKRYANWKKKPPRFV